MSFFSKLSSGWDLAKVSFETINKNRSLMLFPIFSVISLIFVLATFAGGSFFLWGDEIEAMLNDEGTGNILGIVALFGYYLINYFIIVYFNSALIFCASKALNGEETNLSDGLSFANARLGKIFGWAILAATVGTLLRMLQETGKVGEIVSKIIGIGWSILTFFVVPILVFEDKGVIDSVKASGRMMREKWGESLAANVSFGVLNFLCILAALLIGYLLASVNVILGIVVGMLLFLVAAIFFSTAQTVFVAAVYNHVNGQPIGDFDGPTLDAAFINK
ncbi:MAG: hypothetical protein JNJ57_12530 [Saprospiraceae bacterium]|nr:hypothetical protein [Saprospiraceae bacterium]